MENPSHPSHNALTCDFNFRSPEFERELIVERTRDGLAAARARGRKGGRPGKMTASKLAIARQMYDSREHKMADIAAVVGVSRATLYRHLEPAP
jgi:DNA invertase Pin-like site-specific DNA recombinase